MHEQPKDPPGTRRILLPRGMFALVDEANYGWLNRRKWYAMKGKRNNQVYAATKGWVGNRLRTVLMHRMILLGTDQVDHVNTNALDNRLSNLRNATGSQNQCNSPKFSTGRQTSKYKGVHWLKQCRRWMARVTRDRVTTYLGIFEHEEDAARAYDRAAKELHGKFARTNFKGEDT